MLPVVGTTMMLTGAGWALVHTNSLPMVVDMTISARAGTYIGLYYLFSTLGAIFGPIINGWIIQRSGMNYAMTMVASPFILLLAMDLMPGVKRGEAVASIQPVS